MLLWAVAEEVEKSGGFSTSVETRDFMMESSHYISKIKEYEKGWQLVLSFGWEIRCNNYYSFTIYTYPGTL